MLQIGAGKKRIAIPEEILPLEKFHKIHDDIHARVLYIKSNEDFVLASLELTSLREYELQKLRKMISDRLHIHEECVWICVTHTFSAPHTRSEKQLSKPEIKRTNDQFCLALEKAVEGALTDALENLQEADACCSMGHSNVNINRDEETPEGWWLGYDETGFSDKSISIICFKDKQGKPIAILYNYDVQSSIMDNVFNREGYRHISGDLVGEASRYIENVYSDCVAVFLLGAAGDQAPRKKALMKEQQDNNDREAAGDFLYKKGFDYIEESGTQLGRDVIQAIEHPDCKQTMKSICQEQNLSIQNQSSRNSLCQMQFSRKTITCEGQLMPADMHDLHATRAYNYQRNEQKTTSIYALTFGDIALIAVQPELCSITASEIRKKSPYSITFIATMVNGMAKYMADEKSYERMSYEAMNSGFWKGSAELLRDEAINLLQEMQLIYS